MNSEVSTILHILTRVRSIVASTPQDLTWQSRYDSDSDLLADLTDHTTRLQQHDHSRLPDLSTLFAPTGTLCEIAAGSGWLNDYTELGNQLDPLLTRLRQS